MGSTNSKLETTEEYSLSVLFSTEHRKIIIPDFQRDYTWGDNIHGEKGDSDIVSGFMETLIDEFGSNETLLGKIDVYENPTNHIYLTDGQQRITTLFMLIGMLYNKNKNERLKECLISKYEEKDDDKEPYLQYAIRESSVFFIRDLVNEFFLSDKKLKIDDINEKQFWFFSEYNHDPSIVSMLKALKTIERKISGFNDESLTKFSTFVIDKIKIQYYDVGSRKHGEKRFIIINTTGQSLTKSENLKPILLGRVSDEIYSIQWEKRETYFWINRDKDMLEQTADAGVNDFLTWCFQIIKKQDSVDILKKSKELFKVKGGELIDYLDSIDSYHNSLEKFTELLKIEAIQQQFKFVNENKKVSGIIDFRNLKDEKQKNILLPILAFIKKISGEEKDVIQFIRRLRKNYFDKIWKVRNHNYVDWRHVLEIIERSDNLEEILMFSEGFEDFEKMPNVENIIINWYNTEEQLKIKLKEENIENNIEEWEDHKDFMGDISPLLKVSANKKLTDNLSIEDVIVITVIENNYELYMGLDAEYVVNNIYKLFAGKININTGWHGGEIRSHYHRHFINSKLLFQLDGFFSIWKKEKTTLNYISDFIKENGLVKNNIAVIDAFLSGEKLHAIKNLAVYHPSLAHKYGDVKGFQYGFAWKKTKSMKTQPKSVDFSKIAVELHLGENEAVCKERFLNKILEKIKNEYTGTQLYILKNGKDQVHEESNFNNTNSWEWRSVAIPVDEKYLISLTTNNNCLQIGLRKWIEHDNTQSTVLDSPQSDWWYKMDDIMKKQEINFLNFNDSYELIKEKFEELNKKNYL